MRSTSASRLAIVALAIIGTIASAMPAGAMTSRAAATPNPIVIENRHPGSSGWLVPQPGFTVADDNNLQIKGYPSDESVTPGGTLNLNVTTTPAQSFTVDIYRLGYYQNLGGRFLQHFGPFAGIQQPPCVEEPTTRMIHCNWSTTAVLPVSSKWISGVYVAVFTSAGNFQSLAPFWVVEPNRKSDVLFVSALNTYEAYNNFPFDPLGGDLNGIPQTGRSLYDFNSAVINGVQTPSVKVTFDRPFKSQYGGNGNGGVYDFEPELINFLESEGYDVTYTNDPTVDASPSALLQHKTVVMAGHAEYQSVAAYDGLIAARREGVGLAFITANEIYWQIRYEPDGAGAPRRVIVGYKDWAPDPTPDPKLRTIRWRDLGRPEQQLAGVQFPVNGNMNYGGQDYLPQNTDSWAYAGSGLKNGHPVKGEITGYQIDSFDPTIGVPADALNYTLLSVTPFVNSQTPPQTLIQNSSIYQSRDGHNWVWSTGSMDWAWTLGFYCCAINDKRPQLQKVTETILDQMILLAPTP